MHSKRLAFIAAMIAVANLLGLLGIQVGPFRIHFLQLPIILTALALGPIPGAAVGFLGPVTNALSLPSVNPYILPGNAILGFIAGLTNARISGKFKRPIFNHIISVLLAFMVQSPYVYLTDVYLVGMPGVIVQVIVGTLLLEDVLCAFIAHPILFKVAVARLLP